MAKYKQKTFHRPQVHESRFFDLTLMMKRLHCLPEKEVSVSEILKILNGQKVQQYSAFLDFLKLNILLTADKDFFKSLCNYKSEHQYVQ